MVNLGLLLVTEFFGYEKKMNMEHGRMRTEWNLLAPLHLFLITKTIRILGATSPLPSKSHTCFSLVSFNPELNGGKDSLKCCCNLYIDTQVYQKGF